MTLEDLGWDAAYAATFASLAIPGAVPARVTADFGRGSGVMSADGEVLAEHSGKLRHKSARRAQMPVVGDWVAIQPRPGEARAHLLAVLPRRNRLCRQAAGHRRAEEQVLAANIDTVFIVAGLDQEINVRRIERFLSAAQSGGIAPVIVLNKSDIYTDAASAVSTLAATIPSAPIVSTSTEKRGGLRALKPWLLPRKTIAFIGTSGVGKSSLINHLLGDEFLATQEVREHDSKGRHTTSHRELFPGPDGVLLVDTPGMREFQFWDVGTPLSELFPEITSLSLQCRFGNCSHTNEPGCAIQANLATGKISSERLESFRKISAERTRLEKPWLR